MLIVIGLEQITMLAGWNYLRCITAFSEVKAGTQWNSVRKRTVRMDAW